MKKDYRDELNKAESTKDWQEIVIVAREMLSELIKKHNFIEELQDFIQIHDSVSLDRWKLHDRVNNKEKMSYEDGFSDAINLISDKTDEL